MDLGDMRYGFCKCFGVLQKLKGFEFYKNIVVLE
jgi:hypothetical protein